MDPITIGMIAAGGLSGILNFAANSSANDRAAFLQNQALQQFLAIHVPDPAEQKLVMQKFVQTGQLDPKLQSAIQQNPSELSKISDNANNLVAQSKALSSLEQIGDEGGLRLQDKAAIQDALNQQQITDRSNRQAIASNMAQRGLGGSGFDVAAQLQGQQGTSDQAAKNSLAIAANAQDRALQAIEAGGTMAGQMRGQDWQEASAKASEQDAINRFNTQNLQSVANANTAAQNYAQEKNLDTSQEIANANTTNANQAAAYNSGLIQQQYDNELKRAAGATGQYNAMGQTAQQGGQIAGNTISNIGGAAIGGLAAQNQNDFWSNYFKNKNNPAGSATPKPAAAPAQASSSWDGSKPDWMSWDEYTNNEGMGGY